MNFVTDEQKFLESYKKKIIKETLKTICKNYTIYDSDDNLVDFETIQKVKKDVDEELTKQQGYVNKMIQDLNKMQKQLIEKELAIWKRNVVIACLILSIAGGVYLRMKGIL